MIGAHAKGSWRPYWEGLLERLQGSVPTDWQVLVLADRGLYAKWLYAAIVACGWHPFLRINLAVKARAEGEQERPYLPVEIRETRLEERGGDGGDHHQDDEGQDQPAGSLSRTPLEVAVGLHREVDGAVLCEHRHRSDADQQRVRMYELDRVEANVVGGVDRHSVGNVAEGQAKQKR